MYNVDLSAERAIGGHTDVGDVRSPDGFDQPSQFGAFEGRWCVLHTRARNEKALAADLKRMHIPHFLPLVRSARNYGSRMRSVELPLFPGYLFLREEEEFRAAALRTNRIAAILKARDQEGLKADLRQIHRVLTSDVPVDLYPRLRSGRRCRVIGGGLRGLEGIVVWRRSVCRVYVEVTMLGQSAQVEIDASLLEVID